MRTKYIFIIIGIISLIIVVFLTKNINSLSEKETDKIKDVTISKETTSLTNDFNNTSLIVAACPTFYYVLDRIEKEEIVDVLKVESTSDGMKLLSDKKIDVLISGRALRDNEPGYSFDVIGPGYDFIFKDEIIISELEMPFVPFYTNLDSEKVIEDFEYISENNIEKTNNINDYLDKGVVITFLDDKMIGESVHVIKKDGKRVSLSRRPRMYYFSDINKDFLEKLRNIVKEN